MTETLFIRVPFNPVAGRFEAGDNRSRIVGAGATEAEAVMEWYSQAVKAGALDPESPTPPPVKMESQLLALLWPTDFPVYTQKFGERPEVYGKFGLPGHEGVDIRAKEGSFVYACADGVVTNVGWKNPDHPYGYAIRIAHKRIDGEYLTVYAHLMDNSARVQVGQEVRAGQLIARADSTGNVTGAHLHLSLKKRGVTNGGYGELIDPEPFLVMPNKKSMPDRLIG